VDAVQNNAEQAVREMLRTLSEEHGLDPVDHLYAEDFMDDGTPIRLKITIDRNDVRPPLAHRLPDLWLIIVRWVVQGTAVFDFAGTGHEIYGTWPRRRSQVSRVVLTRVVCGACRVCRARAKVT
jgi:5-oxoprolinase (ATP-hydrolysing)